MLERMINERKLPKLSEREKMLEILQREEYGFIPPKPDKFTFTEEKGIVPNFCAGKASLSKIMLSSEINGKIFSFPMYAAIPEEDGKIPFFVHINFRGCVPDRYMPTEELIDNGFAVLSFNYEDVTTDDGDFTSGLAGIIFPEGKRTERAPGKIALWAWAAMRAWIMRKEIRSLTAKGRSFADIRGSGKRRCSQARLMSALHFRIQTIRAARGLHCHAAKQGKPFPTSAGVFRSGSAKNIRHMQEMKPSCRLTSISCLRQQLRALHMLQARRRICGQTLFPSCFAARAASRDFIKNNAAELSGAENIGESRNLHGDRIGYHIRRGKHYFSREDWDRFISFFRYKTDIE